MQAYYCKTHPKGYSNIEIEFLKQTVPDELITYQKAVKSLRSYISAPIIFGPPPKTIKARKFLGELDVSCDCRTLQDLLNLLDGAKKPEEIILGVSADEDNPASIFLESEIEELNPDYQSQMKRYEAELAKNEKAIEKFKVAVAKQKETESTITTLEKKFDSLIKKQLLGVKNAKSDV